MATERIWLHPMQTTERIDRKNYRVTDQGTFQGVRIRKIEVPQSVKVVNQPYRSGILAEDQQGNEKLIFGPADQINQLVGQLKEGGDGRGVVAVMNRLRAIGPSQSNTFYLGQEPPDVTIGNQNAMNDQHSIAARTIYGKQGEESVPRSHAEEEKIARDAHLRKNAERKVLYKSSADGQAAVQAEMDSLKQSQQPGTALTDPGPTGGE